MKTLIPLTIASLVLAVTSLNVSGEALLSPRAKDNQIKTVSAETSGPSTTFNRNVSASPRTLDNQTKIAKGGNTSPNTIAGGCAIGSPRQLEQAGKFTSGDCCKVTSVRCTTPKSCCTVASK